MSDFVQSNPVAADVTSVPPAQAPVTLPHWVDAETQAQTNWCWAAVARAVQRYYRLIKSDLTPPRSQCCFVATQINPHPCAIAGSPLRVKGQNCNTCGHFVAGSNKPGWLPELLAIDGHMVPGRYEPVTIATLNDIRGYHDRTRDEIRGGRPVIFHFHRDDASIASDGEPIRHFVVVYGFNLGAGTFDIWDPDPGMETPVLLSMMYEFGSLRNIVWTQP